MIILRVSMGRGWLKETPNELISALDFAEPVTTHEQSQKECTMTYSIQIHTSEPTTHANSSNTSIKKHISAPVISHV